MPGPKPKVKGKKRKGDASPSASMPSPAAARKGSSAKKSKREEDAPAGVTDSPVDERFAKLPSFNFDIDIESDPEDDADVIDEATLLDHEDDVSDSDAEGDAGEDDEEVKAAYDSDFDIDDDADGDDDAGAINDDDATDDGAMDPAEPELFEFNDDGTEKAPGASSSKKVLSEKALAKARKDQAKRGVIYLGSIPPFMKPQKLRQLLTPYGNLDRMYLMPEDPEMRARRKKFKGNTGKKFVEGWVEFRDKKKAKSCAVMLNGTQVGGRRRGTHFSDLWNMKYLPKFKWDNLTEEIEYQKALREQRMQLELSVAKKERDFYLQKVDQAKQIEKMKERRAAEAVGDVAKLKHLPEFPPEDREETKEEYDARIRREKARQKEERNELLRRFKQREALGDMSVDSARGMMSVDVLRDLFVGGRKDVKSSADEPDE